ncbi:salicylic acid carboxyl methyltransferase [Artemisia annua]|uniref:Salicylic acid carboxyl methyltransferase n=1 Tax=Artemisia annua TaxID=35608 RepID=A0A2U1NUN3_ARTAN|nr:salicylic acid carboxyl methyltransferase [Artemisia annua]
MASEEAVNMRVADFLHMKGGNEKSSYANNSCTQEITIRNVQPLIKKIIKGIANLDGFPQCFNIADLGCSTGPNTLLAVSNIINEVQEVCKEKNLETPQFQVYLNDLFGNDFNSIFKSLPMFYAELNKEQGVDFDSCFISAVPGSFHGRLFPDKSIHLFHSANSLHWLSQVPKGIENNGLNVYLAKTSPPNVFEMYRIQFEKDFTTFLESRSKEIIDGGHMVLALGGRSDIDPSSNGRSCLWELFAKSLADMAKEGLVRESDIQSFNVPMYNPCEDEVRGLIHKQGSFNLDTLESFETNWDPNDTNFANVKDSEEPNFGKRVAKKVRAAAEPMLVTYFGHSAMDLAFQKFGKYMDEHLSTEIIEIFVLVISLTKI